MVMHDSTTNPDEGKHNENSFCEGGARMPAHIDEAPFKENIIRSSSSAIATCDFEGIMNYANPAFLKMGNCSTDEFLGKPFWQFWLVEDRIDEIMQAIRRDGSWFDEIKARRKDGSFFYVRVSASLVADSKGHPVALTSTSTDITDRKRAESALTENDRMLRLAINTAGLAIWDWDIEKDIVIWHNSWPNLIDHPLLKDRAFEWWSGRIHPDDRQSVLSIFDKALSKAAESVGIEYRFLCADGNWAHVYDRCTILRNRSGQACRLIGAMMDMTHLHRMERELRKGEERFRGLANSMPQLVWTACPDGKVDYYNESYKPYKGIESMPGGDFIWSPTLHEEDIDKTIAAWNYSIHTGTAYQIEHRVLLADGRYRWHLTRALPVREGSGKILKWFGTSTTSMI